MTKLRVNTQCPHCKEDAEFFAYGSSDDYNDGVNGVGCCKHCKRVVHFEELDSGTRFKAIRHLAAVSAFSSNISARRAVHDRAVQRSMHDDTDLP